MPPSFVRLGEAGKETGTRVAPAGSIPLHEEACAPSADARVSPWCQRVAWSNDERTVVIQCMIEKQIEVFDFDGRKHTRMPSIKMSGGPASIRTAWRPLSRPR